MYLERLSFPSRNVYLLTFLFCRFWVLCACVCCELSVTLGFVFLLHLL
jgi:hypothetical protein